MKTWNFEKKVNKEGTWPWVIVELKEEFNSEKVRLRCWLKIWMNKLYLELVVTFFALSKDWLLFIMSFSYLIVQNPKNSSLLNKHKIKERDQKQI